MNNIASILLLVFLAVTFIQSGYDKIFYWKNDINWMKEHFAETQLRNEVPLSSFKTFIFTFFLFIILVLELISGILCIVGSVQLFLNNERIFGFYGAILCCITLIILLFVQRLAKDYDGARTIAIYFIPAVVAVYWLN